MVTPQQGNGYYTAITINGVDITEKAIVNGGDTSGLGLTRDTTGWLHLVAKLNFTAQTVDVKLTRNSDGSVVYEGSLPFVNEVSSLEYIYLAAGKLYGVVSIDNVSIYKEVEVVVDSSDSENKEFVYSYTDSDVKGNTSYTYKVAAVVDGKTSYISAPLTLTTAIAIAEVKEIVLDPIVEGTPLDEGQTVADLLPKTIKVVDQDGNEVESEVTWDVSAVDINKVGEYKVKATPKGQKEGIEVTLKVIANEVKGIQALETVKMIVGTTPELPEKVVIEYTNTTTVEKAVTWDTTPLDVNTIADYTLTGTVADFADLKAELLVQVVDNYIVSIPDVYAEVNINSKDVAAQLPTEVSATYADGQVKNVLVAWIIPDDIDTSVIGEVSLTGTVEGFEQGAVVKAAVVYPLVNRFDFGIEGSPVADGWTGIAVNPKGGSKTMAELDVHYTAERGYGFLNADAKFDGRSENFVYAGKLPQAVYNDFAIPDGNTFVVDVPNGKYYVEISGGTVVNGNSRVKSTIEGTALTVGSTGGNYSIGSVEVEVADGQLTVEFAASSISRTNSLVVRQISVDAVTPTPAPSNPSTPSATPTPAPVVPAPIIPPSIDEVVEEVVEDVVEAGTDAISDIKNAETPEEIKEAIIEFVNEVIEIFEKLPIITVKAAKSLATAEAAIAEKGVKLEVDDEDAAFTVSGVSNALFTCTEGGSLEVKEAAVSKEEKEQAMKAGIAEKHLENAIPFDMTLYNHKGESVQPVVPMVVDFELPKDFVGKDVKLVHYGAKGTQIIDVEENGTMGSVVVDGFSTFLLVATDAVKAPGTSDIVAPSVNAPTTVDMAVSESGSSSSILVWICLIVISLAGGALIVTATTLFRKRRDEE